MVLVDVRIEELAEMRLEPFVRALVGSHQPRTTRDVGRQDRCKTAGRGRGTSNPPCSGLSNASLYRQPACRNILASRVVLTPQRASPVEAVGKRVCRGWWVGSNIQCGVGYQLTLGTQPRIACNNGAIP
jgi:hypothetical protein